MIRGKFVDETIREKSEEVMNTMQLVKGMNDFLINFQTTLTDMMETYQYALSKGVEMPTISEVLDINIATHGGGICFKIKSNYVRLVYSTNRVPFFYTYNRHAVPIPLLVAFEDASANPYEYSKLTNYETFKALADNAELFIREVKLAMDRFNEIHKA